MKSKIAFVAAITLLSALVIAAEPSNPSASFESNYPTYVLQCSNVKPAPFEDCYPVFVSMKLDTPPVFEGAVANPFPPGTFPADHK